MSCISCIAATLHTLEIISIYNFLYSHWYNGNNQRPGVVYHEIIYSASLFNRLNGLGFASSFNLLKQLGFIDYFMISKQLPGL